MIIVSCFQGIAHGITWNSSVTLQNVQYSIKNTYNSTPSLITLKKGILGPSGNFYFEAMTDGTDAIFQKEDADRNVQWTYTYPNFHYFHQSMSLKNDETALYVIREGITTSVDILEINAADGTFLRFLSE